MGILLKKRMLMKRGRLRMNESIGPKLSWIVDTAILDSGGMSSSMGMALWWRMMEINTKAIFVRGTNKGLENISMQMEPCTKAIYGKTKGAGMALSDLLMEMFIKDIGWTAVVISRAIQKSLMEHITLASITVERWKDLELSGSRTARYSKEFSPNKRNMESATKANQMAPNISVSGKMTLKTDLASSKLQTASPTSALSTATESMVQENTCTHQARRKQESGKTTN